jgi:hypothetical protein
VRAGLSWSETRDVDMVEAQQILRLAIGKRETDGGTTYVSRRTKKTRTKQPVRKTQ